MVGHRLTLGEQRLQGDAAYTPFRGLFRRQEGVVYQHVQFAAVQHPDHHRADHAGADDPHLAADIAWKAGGVPSGGLHLAGAAQRRGPEKTLVGQQDLADRELRHRHGVGSPGAEYPDTPV